MSHGPECTCFTCVTRGPTRCSSKCVLRHGHAGPHAGWLRMLRMASREIVRIVASEIAIAAGGKDR